MITNVHSKQSKFEKYDGKNELLYYLQMEKSRGKLDRRAPNTWCIRGFGLYNIEMKVHDFCWQRLLQHFDTRPNLSRLVRTLEETHKPIYREKYRRNRTSCSGIRRLEHQHLRSLLRARRSWKSLPVSDYSRTSSHTASSVDCFLSLPPEIRFCIAQYLTTGDFLKMRLVSKCMASLFESQQFWRTRFLLPGERGYLSFLAEEGYQIDWRLLYQRTCSESNLTLKLSDLRHQWLIRENVRDRYMMVAEALHPLTDSSMDMLGPLSLDSAQSSDWKTIPTPCTLPWKWPEPRHLYHTRSLSQTHSDDAILKCGRCGTTGYLTESHTVAISHPILKLSVSILVEHETTYITGFDLIHGFDIHGRHIPDTQFGYRIPGKEVILDLRCRALKGFQAKSKWLAIHAIRPLTDEDELIAIKSMWAGDPGLQRMCSEKTARLAGNESIGAISGDFQDRKLVGLSIRPFNTDQINVQ